MFFWTHELAAAPGRHGVRFAVTSRRGGSGGSGPSTQLDLGSRSADRASVEANRSAVAAAFGLPRDRLLFMNQCHGADAVRADGPWTGDAPRVDAMVTTRDDLALAALSADCVPVLLADPVAGVVGAVHAGRPGMVTQVVDRAFDALLEAGASPRDTVAVVGPSVCGRCYEVPEGMRAEAATVSPPSATVSWSGTPAIDVAAGVVDQLAARAVPVTWVPGCTRESHELFSYRRDRTTGRFAGIVQLLPPSAP